MSDFYKKIMSDVSKWQKTASGVNELEENNGYRIWQAKQVKPYAEESQELVDAKTDEEHIDAIFDTIWTALNFGVYSEGHIIEALETDFHQMTGRTTRDNIIYSAERGRRYSVINFAALQVKEALQLAEQNGYSVSKMWSIGSKSNWAKFAANEDDAKASIDYYAEQGVKCEYTERGKVFVITAKGEQKDNNGKHIFDGKILKAGKLIKGEFKPWSEPNWSSALPKKEK